MPKSIAILGSGVCSPFGGSVHEFVNACYGGAASVKSPTAVVCPDDFVDDAVLVEYPDPEPKGRVERLLRQAVMMAIQDCNLPVGLREQAPFYIGTGLRGLRDAEIAVAEKAVVSPSVLDVGTMTSRELGFVRHLVVSNACSAGLFALSLALTDLSAHNAPPCAVVAGVDTVTESLFALIRQVQGDGPHKITPFDAERRGTIPGEGAAALVIGPASMVGSGSDVFRVLSVATNCDAWHVTAPHIGSIVEVTREAHRQAGVCADEIDLVMLHGTGTKANDASESLAMAEIFGFLGSSGPVMTTIKGTTGHTAGASGIQSIIVGLDAMRNGRVPGITGLSVPTSEASQLSIVKKSCCRDVRTVQVNAFGFGGLNAVAVLQEGA